MTDPALTARLTAAVDQLDAALAVAEQAVRRDLAGSYACEPEDLPDGLLLTAQDRNGRYLLLDAHTARVSAMAALVAAGAAR